MIILSIASNLRGTYFENISTISFDIFSKFQLKLPYSISNQKFGRK